MRNNYRESRYSVWGGDMLRLEFVEDNLNINSASISNKSQNIIIPNEDVIVIDPEEKKEEEILPVEHFTEDIRHNKPSEKYIEIDNKNESNSSLLSILDDASKKFIDLMELTIKSSEGSKFSNIFKPFVEEYRKTHPKEIEDKITIPYCIDPIYSGRESSYTIDDWGFNTHLNLLSLPSEKLKIYPFGDHRAKIVVPSNIVILTFEDSDGRKGIVVGVIDTDSNPISIDKIEFMNDNESESFIDPNELIFPLTIDWEVIYKGE